MLFAGAHCRLICDFAPTVNAIEEGIKKWPAGDRWATRKTKLFDGRVIGITLERLQQVSV